MAKEVTIAKEASVSEKARNALTYTERRVLSLMQVANSRYNDISKVSVDKTYMGNWRLYYEDRDTGLTVGKNELNGNALRKKVW